MYRAKGVHPFPLCFENVFFQTEEGLYSFIFKRREKEGITLRGGDLPCFLSRHHQHRTGSKTTALLKTFFARRNLRKKGRFQSIFMVFFQEEFY